MKLVVVKYVIVSSDGGCLAGGKAGEALQGNTGVGNSDRSCRQGQLNANPRLHH